MSRPHTRCSRREFLTSVAALGAGTLVPVTGSIAQTGSVPAGSQSGRIDVHSPVAPPVLIRALGPQRLGGGLAAWTPEKSLEDMNGAGVSTSMISIAPAGNPFSDPATAT